MQTSQALCLVPSDSVSVNDVSFTHANLKGLVLLVNPSTLALAFFPPLLPEFSELSEGI